jgi:bifunctional non-homologous end joining protein LigD
LATLESSAPTGDSWLHEVKFDGYRMEARLEKGRVTWISRNGLDWTSRFASLSPSIVSLPAESALLDGEVVVLGDDGVSHFQDLQQALGDGGAREFTYFAFDLIHVDGLDLRRCELIDRKRVLQALLAHTSAQSPVRYSEHIVGGGPEFLVEACRARLEGIVSKRSEGSYVSQRTRDWVKTKCGLRQEFVVAGFTQPSGSRVGFGSLVLGVHDKKKFLHAGRVGTGFGRDLLVKLRKRLDTLVIDAPPFDAPIDSTARRGVTWVKPQLVVEVAFTGWTSDGSLRHPSFEGLREDKAPDEVVREKPKSQLRASTRERSTPIHSVGKPTSKGRPVRKATNQREVTRSKTSRKSAGRKRST